MGLSVYKASAPDVAEIAKKLPIGSRNWSMSCT